MSPVRVDIVTAERVVYSEDVDIVIAPGALGQLGILPHHAPLMTSLEPGELITRTGAEAENRENTRAHWRDWA